MLQVLSLVFAALTLVACGGGGSDSSPAPAPVPFAPSFSTVATVSAAAELVTAPSALILEDATPAVSWTQFAVPPPRRPIPDGAVAQASGTVWGGPLPLGGLSFNSSDDVMGATTSDFAGPYAIIAFTRLSLNGNRRPELSLRVNGSWPSESGPGSPTTSELAVAVNEAGVFAHAWEQAGRISAGRRTTQSNDWRPLVLQTDATAVGTSPSIAVDSAGNVMVVWQETPAASTQVRIASRLFTASNDLWGPVQFVDLGSAPVRQPRVTAIGAGEFVAVWEQSEASRFGIRASRFSGLWATPTVLQSDVAADATQLQMSRARNGVAVAAWRHETSSGTSIRAARLVNNAWSPALQVTPAGSTSNTAPRVAVSSDGVHIVWLRTDAPRNEVLYSRMANTASTWEQPIEMDGSSTSATAPTLAVGSTGVVLVAWLRGTGTTADLVARIKRP